MITNRDIVCFSNDWDGDPLSKKHIMLRLARNNRVLWVNSIGNRKPAASVRDIKRAARKVWSFTSGCRRVADNIYVLPPIAIPFFGSAAARRINRWLLAFSLRRACRDLDFRNPITWTFLPTSADIAGTFGDKFVIYHCVDEFSEFTGTNKQAILEMERRLMRKADMVIASSALLFENKKKYNPNTFFVSHGVDVEHFRKACGPELEIPDDIARLPRPIVGFHGLIADWVDLNLIRSLAIERPHWTFALVGKVETDLAPVQGLTNVHVLGRKDYRALPAYCKSFDVAILPFLLNELTLAANPLKLREYLAAGLPVVSTAIPEAQRIGGNVLIAADHSQFLKHIETALASGSGPQPQISRKMDAESWDAKIEEISRLVETCAA